MNLIISLLGKKKEKLFNKKFIYNNKQNKYQYLLDEIIDRFIFCKRIFIICSKIQIDKKKVNFKKSKKVKIIYSNHTPNQIKSILKVKNFIKLDEEVAILNPDLIFEINNKDFENHINDKIFRINDLHGKIFNISSEDLRRSYGKKDTLITTSDIEDKITKIQKKQKFPYNQKVSAGLYYLKEWNFFLEGVKKVKNINKQAFHVADVMSQIIKNKNIYSARVKNFVCFEDSKKLIEYNFWKKYFIFNHSLHDKLNKVNIQNIIPSAGEGSRHKHLGYNLPKPMIPISKKKMFERSIESLPNKKNNLFIFRKKTFNKYKLKKSFSSKTKTSNYFTIKSRTKGMAITISKARKFIHIDRPVIVSSCDLKCVINYSKFYKIIKNHNPEAMIFTWTQYPFASESPNSHAYVNDKNLIINKISEKKTISLDPDNDSAVTGIFYFNSGKILLDCIDYSIKNKITVNGEYYIATAMTKLLNENKKIINFKVDQMISWSLPEHLLDYLYWERIFINENSKI